MREVNIKEIFIIKKVYLVLDNNLESCIATTDIFSSRQKAEREVKNILADLDGQYEAVKKVDEDSWTLIYSDSVNRVVEIRETEVQ